MALKAQSAEHRSVAMEDGDKVQRTRPNDLPPFEPNRATLEIPMSKTLALAAAAAITLGASFTGTSSAEAGYYGHRHYGHYSYGHSYGYRHFHYKHHYVYKPVYVYKPAYVYQPVCSHWGWTFNHGYKQWACLAW